MNVLDYSKHLTRMCDEYYNKIPSCDGCPLRNKQCIKATEIDEEAVKAVEEWVESHPIKTRMSEFLKMFPNAIIWEGVPTACPKQLGGLQECPLTKNGHCVECCKEYWLQEVD